VIDGLAGGAPVADDGTDEAMRAEAAGSPTNQ
jgi:hypothetical protein